MAGIYFHIPFCRKACHYCDFHFTTSFTYRLQVLQAMQKELYLRKSFLGGDNIESIYFGGGTPSVLHPSEIEALLAQVDANFLVSPRCEITLEANPEDLSSKTILAFSKTPINRLSIGVQSFFEEDLRYMNRSHNAKQALESIKASARFFKNISIDLIYGLPSMSIERWQKNLQTAYALPIQHISAYALTVEPKTPLQRWIKQQRTSAPKETTALQHFELLRATALKQGFTPYEISNFGKRGFFSKHNTSYWKGTAYLGIGAAAHSFDGQQRSWNVANNIKYFKALKKNTLPLTSETLTRNDLYNEYVMTALRTIWGIDLERVRNVFGTVFYDYLQKQSEKYRLEKLLTLENHHLKHTEKGAFLIDGIAADLFWC